MTDSAQILIDELDALNGKVDKIALDAEKIEHAAKRGASSGAATIQNEARTIHESSLQFTNTGQNLVHVIQQELIPAAKKERRKPLKIALRIFLMAFLFVSGFTFAQFLTIPRFGPFLSESKHLCELAKGSFTERNPDGTPGYCIFWQKR